MAGGWQGALYGGLIGGAIGIVAPHLSAWAGAAAGGEMAGAVVATGTFIATGAATGYVTTVYTNLMGGKDNLGEGAVFGAAVGVFAPLASGEAFVIGAGGKFAVGVGGANTFSAATGVAGVAGGAMDSGGQHGFNSNQPNVPSKK